MFSSTHQVEYLDKTQVREQKVMKRQKERVQLPFTFITQFIAYHKIKSVTKQKKIYFHL